MKHMIAIYEIEDDSDLSETLSANPSAKFIAMTPGIKQKHLGTGEEVFLPYARYFSEESSTHWHRPEFQDYNWLFLRSQQNWANDMLKARGYVALNDVYDCLGLSRTAMGAVVGWVYEKGVSIDFGCWGAQEETETDSILLDFNVQGPILHALA